MLLQVGSLFALLDGHFLAAIQVLVYAGAIMVLFLFVTMLLNLQDHELGAARWNLGKGVAAASAAYVTWQIAKALLRAGRELRHHELLIAVRRVVPPLLRALGLLRLVREVLLR